MDPKPKIVEVFECKTPNCQHPLHKMTAKEYEELLKAKALKAQKK